MKAVVYTHYGAPEVLRLAEIARPVPKDREVLVKVRATTVTIGDCRMRRFSVPPKQWLFARLYLGVFRPRRPILGMELAGVIEAVGALVTRFRHCPENRGGTCQASCRVPGTWPRFIFMARCAPTGAWATERTFQ